MLQVSRRLIDLPAVQTKGEQDLKIDEDKAFWARARIRADSGHYGRSYYENLFKSNHLVFHDKSGVHSIGPTVK